MLVLTRKSEQTILIGENITVALLGIDIDGAKLGISAPGDVIIHREELDPEDIPLMIHERHGGMLVLHRQAGEGVAIGETVFVRVLKMRSHRIKVGIDAPSDVKVERGENTSEGIPRRYKERF